MTKPCLPGLFSADVQLRDPLRFDGATIDETIDPPRLGRQLLAVYWTLESGGWLTLADIAHGASCHLIDAHVSEASASARLRDLRKPRFGGHVIERQRVGKSGLFRYRLVI